MMAGASGEHVRLSGRPFDNNTDHTPAGSSVPR